jgi:DNA polymerase-4
LDVTESPYLKTTVTELAKEIKEKIFSKTDLTASAGVGPNKFIAKIASDYRKPNGLTVIKPKEIKDFLSSLPIGKMWGVGEVTERYFKSLGVERIGQVRNIPLQTLINEFGKSGFLFYKLALGQDDRRVEPSLEYKSIGQETTFEKDTTDLEYMKEILQELCQSVSQRLTSDQMKAHTVTLKVKYFDFKSITRSQTFLSPIQKAFDLVNIAQTLLTRTEAGSKPIRLLGVSASNFNPRESLQLLLFKDLL